MKKYLNLVLLVSLIVLSACGTTEAAETTAPTQANIDTSTQPSSTSYSLEITVTDTSGNPIPWATGNVEGLGSGLSKSADDAGTMTWNGLSNNSGTVIVSAQGYIPSQQSVNLIEGLNDISMTLEADPLQLDPATVCKAGQTVIFVEDFEDSLAQDFIGVSPPIWNIKKLDDRGAVLEAAPDGTGSNIDILSEWDNGMLQFEMLASGSFSIDLFIHSTFIDEGLAAGLYRYVISNETDKAITLGYELPTESDTLISSSDAAFDLNTWHTINVAFFDGEISVYLDGIQQLTFTHDVPIDGGEFGFFINGETEGIVQFDNIIVCSLEAAYTP